MKRTLLVANGMLWAALLASAQKTPEAMLGAAQHQEEVQGDLKGAVAAYQKVVAMPGVSRKTAAEALVRLGQCYEKLGSAESRKAYERVVKDYAEQKEAVALAQRRLGKSVGSGRPTSTLVWSGAWNEDEEDDGPYISPDGRFLTIMDDNGDLILHDIAAGTSRSLTGVQPQKGPLKVFAEEPVISRDGTQVAFHWVDINSPRSELRIASLAGEPNPRRLYELPPEHAHLEPCDWSPDGKSIAVRITLKNRTDQIGIVSVSDGLLRVLKSTKRDGSQILLGCPVFSPDGKHLGYDMQEKESSPETAVFVVAIDTARDTRVVSHSGRDVMMGWSPDGKLLFSSDRTGSMDLWALPFAAGQPQGNPQRLQPGIGEYALRVTSSGTMYYVVHFHSDERSRIQISSLDPGSGKLVSATDLKQDGLESNGQPSWSPDGKYLAYFSERLKLGAIYPDHFLSIHSAETGGVVHDWPFEGPQTVGRWSADGHFILVNGGDSQGRRGWHRMDTQTGEVTPAALDIPGADLQMWASALSPDGKSLYYRRTLPGTEGVAFVQRDLASGTEKDVIRRAALGMVTLSADGQYLATGVPQASGGNAILLIPVSGEAPREIIRVNGAEEHVLVAAFAPDSRSVLVRNTPADEIWRVPLNGDAPVSLGLRIDVHMPGLTAYAVNPDGRRVAIVVREKGLVEGRMEIRALENFLPAPAAKH